MPETTELQLTESEVKALANGGYVGHAEIRALIRDLRALRQIVEIQSRESDGDLTTIQKALAENAALREQLAQAHSDNKRLARVIQDIEEREAAVCPEDVGFDEYIRTLERRLKTRPQAGYPWTGNEP